MRGIKVDDLLAIVDFLYRGEANVFQENLDSFLAIAQELELKGLKGKLDENVRDFEEVEKPLPPLPAFNTIAKIAETKREKTDSRNHNPGENGALAIPSNFSGDLEELEERVKSMMEKSGNKIAVGPRHTFADICKVCRKEGLGSNIKDHIEANHLEGIIIPCNLCDKTFSSRNGLRQHKRQHHS